MGHLAYNLISTNCAKRGRGKRRREKKKGQRTYMSLFILTVCVNTRSMHGGINCRECISGLHSINVGPQSLHELDGSSEMTIPHMIK